MPDRQGCAGLYGGTSRHAQLGLECTGGLKETQTEGSSETGLQLGNGQGKQFCVPLWDGHDLAGPSHFSLCLKYPALHSQPDLGPFEEVSFFLDFPAKADSPPQGLCPVCSSLTCVYLCRLDAYRGGRQDAATCLEIQWCCSQEAEPSQSPRLGHVGGTCEGCHRFSAHVLEEDIKKRMNSGPIFLTVCLLMPYVFVDLGDHNYK